MSLERKGYVGLFAEPLNRERIAELVMLWIERHGSVEQIFGAGGQVLTQRVHAVGELMWEDNLQFRIVAGEQFAWIYMTINRQVVETSGLIPESGDALCRDVLEELPGCCEIIDDHNDRRLDELEAKGLM